MFCSHPSNPQTEITGRVAGLHVCLEPLRTIALGRVPAVTTFDSTKSSLSDLLRDIKQGKIQLPDFQRGWVWDDERIQSLLVSVGRSFPISAIMLLETGGDLRFQARPIEGLEEKIGPDVYPERLVLDGQQRLTALTQALLLQEAVDTTTTRRQKIKRYYYFDIQKALQFPEALDEAILAVDERKQIRSDFGRKIELDLSTTEQECKHLCFPCNQIMNSDLWEMTLHRVAPEFFGPYMKFREQVLKRFREYQLPIILLRKETSKEAVCLVFEKVNTGGVILSVFDLLTASYAAEGYRLRQDWYGTSTDEEPSRRERLTKHNLLKGLEATEFLQAATLLHTLQQKQADTGKQVGTVSAKRTDILRLPLTGWKLWADNLEAGFVRVASFLRKECFYSPRELPYSTQLVPLAAVLTRLGDRWLEPAIYDKLTKWFWSGVLGELYGGSVDTRIANDYEDLMQWLSDDSSVPRTVRDANFQLDRFDTLRTRVSAAYKGINVLVLRQGAKDWFWKASVQELDIDEVALDVHHIFPQDWCKKQGIEKSLYDSVLNKTLVSYKANRKMGGDAPSKYLSRIQNEPTVGLDDDAMDRILETHALSPRLLRRDAFYEFIEDRRARLSTLIEQAMGKQVSRPSGVQ